MTHSNPIFLKQHNWAYRLRLLYMQDKASWLNLILKCYILKTYKLKKVFSVETGVDF